MTTKTTHRATYKGGGPYRGVVKDESGRIVAECEHWHRNRDAGSALSGGSARGCALELLRKIDPAAYEASLPSWTKAPW